MMEDDPLGFWRSVDDLTVRQAALLVHEFSPHWSAPPPDEAPVTEGVLMTAIRKGRLPASLEYAVESTSNIFEGFSGSYHVVSGKELSTLLGAASSAELAQASEVALFREPDWTRTTIRAADLRDYYASRPGPVPPFFRTTTHAEDPILDPDHPHFAPELALAIRAWRALEAEKQGKRSTKMLIKKWIDDNHQAYTETASLSNSAKERVATVVNWNPEGGAPKTG